MPFAERDDSGIKELDLAKSAIESARLASMFETFETRRDPYWSPAFQIEGET